MAIPFSELPTPPKPVQQFNAEIQILLKAKNAEVRSILAYIDRLLQQYRLQGRFSVIDIFIIAYLRGVEHLLDPSKKPIRKPKPWMRVTILNVIREQNRLLKKECALPDEVVDHSTEQLIDDFVIAGSLEAAVQAFSRLSEQDRKIIELKKLQGKSWKKILEELEEPTLTYDTLRKRGQRALENLRKEYHEIRPPVDRDDG